VIPAWRQQGFRVKLFFLRLAWVALAVERLGQRVAAGGDDVPEPVIRPPFAAGCRSVESLYRHLVDECAVYDNAGTVPRLRDRGVNL
jgi:predicted ABC-type ATPase